MRFNHSCNPGCLGGQHRQIMFVETPAGKIPVEDFLDVVEADMEKAFRSVGLTLTGCDLAPESTPSEYMVRAVERVEDTLKLPGDWMETPPDVVGVALRFTDPDRPTPDQIASS